MADAEDRTEAPSARRLEQAREDGNIALSREVQVFAGLAIGALALLMCVHQADALCVVLRGVLDHAGDISGVPGGTFGVLGSVAWAGALAVLPVCGLAAVGAVATGVLQTGFLLRPQALLPDFSRVDPISGLSRILSGTTAVEALKAVAKCACFGVVLWWQASSLLHDQARAMGDDAGSLLREIMRILPGTIGALLLVQLAIAGFDVLWQRMHRLSGLRMSRQEMRDEYRQTEGDPHVKGKLKMLRARAAKRRMMDAVKTATVIVTNPTHYAVALSYERGVSGAPRIVAKGVDEVAARIRELAQDHRVPIVSNPPLARALYPLPLETEVPAEHFKVVAGIIAYIWRLRSPPRRGALVG
jgi:flagellar biosynthesis protein FlhB